MLGAYLLVVLRQGLDHLPCLLELGIHPLDLPFVARVFELGGDPAQRDIQRLDIALQGQVHLRRRDGDFFEGARQDCGEAGGGITDEICNGGTHRLIEPGRRIGDTGVDVIMVNENLVVGMAAQRAFADHVRDEAEPARNRDVRIAFGCDPGVGVGARFCNAPLHSAVDHAFGFRLAGMEGLDGVCVVVAQHAEGIGRVAPAFERQQFHAARIPFLRLGARAAPFAFADMQDVVLEVLELGVRRFGALQEMLVMHQEQRFPGFAIVSADQGERIERNKMVCRAAAVVADHAFKQGHRQILRGSSDSVAGDSPKMVNALLTRAARLASRRGVWYGPAIATGAERGRLPAHRKGNRSAGVPVRGAAKPLHTQGHNARE